MQLPQTGRRSAREDASGAVTLVEKNNPGRANEPDVEGSAWKLIGLRASRIGLFCFPRVVQCLRQPTLTKVSGFTTSPSRPEKGTRPWGHKARARRLSKPNDAFCEKEQPAYVMVTNWSRRLSVLEELTGLSGFRIVHVLTMEKKR